MTDKIGSREAELRRQREDSWKGRQAVAPAVTPPAVETVNVENVENVENADVEAGVNIDAAADRKQYQRDYYAAKKAGLTVKQYRAQGGDQ